MREKSAFTLKEVFKFLILGLIFSLLFFPNYFLVFIFGIICPFFHKNTKDRIILPTIIPTVFSFLYALISYFCFFGLTSCIKETSNLSFFDLFWIYFFISLFSTFFIFLGTCVFVLLDKVWRSNFR